MTECILWTGPRFAIGGRSLGYGRIWKDGRNRYVHRVVWENEHGPITEGLCVHHICTNILCINTDHLELVDRREHARLHRRIRPQAEECSNGHKYTPENTYSYRGYRVCRVCRNRAKRDSYHRLRAA